MKEILLDLIHNKTFIITLIIALTPFIIKIIGGILTKRTRSQEETINQDIIINAEVSELKHETDASLVFIFKHHNGGHFYDGKPMEKMTMVYLRGDDNINIDTSRYINIPISYFGDMVHHLYTKEKILQPEILTCNRENDLKDHKYRNMMIILGMKSHYALAVYKNVWKINLKWRGFREILFPLTREKILVASIHWCLKKPYSEMKYTEDRITKNIYYGQLYSEKIKTELLK